MIRSVRVSTVAEVVAAVVTLHLLLAGVSQGCICGPPQTFVEIYCSADFVMRASPVSSRYDPPGSHQFTAMQRIYNVSVVQPFKAPAARSSLQHWTIFTSPNEGMCGAELMENTEYLLTGRVFGDTAVMNNCMSWIMPWSQLLPWEKKGVRKNYKLYCPGARANSHV